MLNLGTFVSDQAKYHPDRTALRLGDQEMSYGELDAASNKVANFLTASGVGEGDKVALSCPNLPHFPVVYYGVLKAGAVVVPLNVLLKSREIAYHLQDSDAEVYFVFEGSEELPMARYGLAAFEAVESCKQLVVITADSEGRGDVPDAVTLGHILADQPAAFQPLATAPEDTAVILYTSGTTGRPKGAELTHSNMVLNAMISNALARHRGMDPHEHVCMTVLPLFHSFGQTVCMNSMFYGGGQITMMPRFDAAQVLKIMRAHRVTIFAGVPTMYWALLNEVKNLGRQEIGAIRSDLRFALSGGAALPLEILTRFEEVYGIAIMEGYGLSETSPVASFNHADRPRKPGTVGQPIFGVEMRVVDENDAELPVDEAGEIVIRGHNVMKGYYRRPEATAEAMRGGWFHTGDIGVMGEDGYFRIVDRLKDMILRGGFNVYPREVEEMLITHPDVSLAAVVGIPHQEHGEEIKAFVVPREGSSVTAEELIAWSKERMAAYKYPRLVEFRDSLPMNATGKILRRELRE